MKRERSSDSDVLPIDAATSTPAAPADRRLRLVPEPLGADPRQAEESQPQPRDDQQHQAAGADGRQAAQQPAAQRPPRHQMVLPLSGGKAL